VGIFIKEKRRIDWTCGAEWQQGYLHLSEISNDINLNEPETPGKKQRKHFQDDG